MLQSQRIAAPCSSAHEGPHLPAKPPSLGCYFGTRQGKGAETQLVGPWQDPALLQVCRTWLGVGSMGGQGCVLSSSWFITPGGMVTVAVVEEPISWLAQQERGKWQTPTLPASHQKIGDKCVLLQLCCPCPLGQTHIAQLELSHTPLSRDMMTNYLHCIYFSSIFSLRNDCLLVCIGSCMVQTSK